MNVEAHAGTCLNCRKETLIFSFYDEAGLVFAGCGSCFIQAIQRVIRYREEEVMLLKDLLYQARETLTKGSSWRQQDRLVEAIDLSL